jgi:hypothetical protein
MSQIDVICSRLPFVIHIREPKEEMGITEGDLLRFLYLALQEKVTDEEFNKEHPDNQKAIQKAFEDRCDRLLERSIPQSVREREFGVRRIDYLRGHHIFAGFDVVPKEIPTLRLHVRSTI